MNIKIQFRSNHFRKWLRRIGCSLLIGSMVCTQTVPAWATSKAEKEKKAKEAARKKQGAKKAAPKTLKEELADKVFEADAAISEKGEVEKPVRVIKTRKKAEKE